MPFREVKRHWFCCPSCGHKAWLSRLSARYGRWPLQMRIIYQCDHCGGLCRGKGWLGPWSMLIALGEGVVVFVLLYQYLSHLKLPFLGLIAVVTVIAAIGQILQIALGRLLNRYSPIDGEDK